jgi:2-polyprenyl-6-methoxyphenol hydroxylase-like FAD-dependent oxidoreductase
MSGHAEIVGAGVGGLAAGIALRQAGWSVHVLERSNSVEETGAALSIWPNAVHSLRSLGVGELADDEHAWFSDGALRRADGSAITRFPESLEGRYGAPLAAVHRGDLRMALAEKLGGDSINFGAEVEEIGEQGTVRLSTGEVREADLIVGADGLRSTARSVVIGPEEPRSSGIVAFRGVTSRAGVEIPAGEWWGAGSIAGLLPLSRDRVYWYVGFRGDPDTGSDELQRRASEYATPVPELVAATPPAEVLRHELFDRPPARRWSKGVVTLLGDAAHPMLPFLGQGACSALDDAVALGAAVAQAGDDVRSALRAYEQVRVKQAARLVRGSRSAARLALARPSVARAIRNGSIRALPASVRLRQLDGIVGRRAYAS